MEPDWRAARDAYLDRTGRRVDPDAALRRARWIMWLVPWPLFGLVVAVAAATLTGGSAEGTLLLGLWYSGPLATFAPVGALWLRRHLDQCAYPKRDLGWPTFAWTALGLAWWVQAYQQVMDW